MTMTLTGAVIIVVGVNNSKLVQFLIFRWNPWTANWIMCDWSESYCWYWDTDMV